MKYFDFLKSSKYYVANGDYFIGNFDNIKNHTEKLFHHYLSTNENLLNGYVELIHLSWNYNDDKIFLEENEIKALDNMQSKFRSLKILDFETLLACRLILKKSKINLIKFKANIDKKPRREAQKFISKSYIRKEVFKKYGKKCLSCGSIKNIQLDHVNPVYLGGANTINNLQPLCKSCNVKKGTKNIDYR